MNNTIIFKHFTYNYLCFVYIWLSLNESMKQFIRKCLFFLVPFLLFVGITLSVYFIRKESILSQINRISQATCLLIGDSHIKRFHEDWFGVRAYNFSSFGEPYYITYEKLRRVLLVDSCKVKTVIAGVSFHNFTPVFYRLMNLNFPEGRSCIERYHYFLDVNNSLYKSNEIMSREYIKGIYSKPDMGGLFYSDRSNPDSLDILRTVNSHYSYETEKELDYGNQLMYLLKIDSICHVYNIDLYYVATPYHRIYINNVERHYFDNLSLVLNKVEYGRFINLYTQGISSDYMADADHLNFKGGEIIAKMLVDSISLYTSTPF